MTIVGSPENTATLPDATVVVPDVPRLPIPPQEAMDALRTGDVGTYNAWVAQLSDDEKQAMVNAVALMYEVEFPAGDGRAQIVRYYSDGTATQTEALLRSRSEAAAPEALPSAA